MNILVIENDDAKYNGLHAELSHIFDHVPVHIVRSATTANATKKIYQQKFDLIIIDLMMPQRMDDVDEDISEEIIQIIEESGINTATNAIALSAFQELVEPARARFSQAGIFIVFYGEGDEWKDNLSSIIKKLHCETVFDFVIVCALEKERQALHHTRAEIGSTENIRGLDCMHLRIADLQGVCIKPPRMGLVEAAVIAARAMERFQPKAIAMSGICAGVNGESKTGQIIVADTCWEYQSGKLTDDGFKMEPYSIQLRHETKTKLTQFSRKDICTTQLSSGLCCNDLHNQEILLAPMCSGSAVISSQQKMKDIAGQHRKVAALEMEMYGVYKAAEMSNQEPIFFGAKTVVDLGDSSKTDEYQEYGASLSARFVVEAIDELLNC